MDRCELVEALYNTYQNLMLSIARDILQDHYLAEDVVHECVIRLLKAKILEVDDLYAPSTRKLVQIVARNQAYRQYNKYHKGTFCTFDMDFVSDQTTKNLYAYTEISDLLQNLPPVYREVILLRIHYGYSYKQVGVLLGIRPQTARNHMVKVRKRIRKEWRGGDKDA